MFIDIAFRHLWFFFSGQFCFLSVAIETKTKLSIDILTPSVFLVLCKSVTADVQVKNGIRTRMCVCSLLSRNISLIYVCPQNTSFKKDFVVFGIWYVWCFWCQIKLHFSFKYVRRLWNYEKMSFPTEFLRFYRPRSFTWKSIHSQQTSWQAREIMTYLTRKYRVAVCSLNISLNDVLPFRELFCLQLSMIFQEVHRSKQNWM